MEKTNGILTKQVADLKSDIADVQARIEKLQGDNGSDEGTTTDASSDDTTK